MARPERNNVDYFPFICEDGNKMFYIEETYGNDGFATFVKLLRELAKTNYHYLDLSKPSTMMFLSAKCKVSKEVLNSIINDLVDLGKFDKMLWTENKIIWCQDFIDSIQDAYSKRNNKCITFEGLIILLQSLGVRKQSKGSSKGVDNTQSKVEYSKEDNNKENEYDKYNFGLFKQSCIKWLKYKKERKETYKSETSINSFFNKLVKLSNNNPTIAAEIIEQSIANNWAGIFEIKNKVNASNGRDSKGMVH